jgi:hypothetical protein
LEASFASIFLCHCLVIAYRIHYCVEVTSKIIVRVKHGVCKLISMHSASFHENAVNKNEQLLKVKF